MPARAARASAGSTTPPRGGSHLRRSICEKNGWRRNLVGRAPLYPPTGGVAMLVERGLQAMNVELVSEAYAIAANYLRRSGVIADTLVTNERLLEIIVKLIQHGEFNKIRLANRAISRFEARAVA
jgi:hypothetical protein